MRCRSAVLSLAAIAVVLAIGGTTTSAGAQGADPPQRDLRTYEPKALDVIRERAKLAGRDERRAIVIEPGRVLLVRGADTKGSLPLPNESGPVTLGAVADLVGDGWLEVTAPGILTARAAIVQAPGTTLETGPDVDGTRELRLASLPHVFLGGVGARARLEGVTVTSWDEREGRPVTRIDGPTGRPFILYENASRLEVVDSEIAYLGYDRSTAYGLSWREGSTGSVVRSDVHHNFFGAYTFRAHRIRFIDSAFHHNVLYGLDPHDDSTRLEVIGNDAYANGSHGIIFSVRVIDSVVRRNRSHDNGGNGIVMDFESDRNVLEGNEVANNAGDGIVILGSSDAVVRDNDVTGNRVGLRVSHESHRNVMSGNRVAENERGIHVYDGADDTRLERNEVTRSSSIGIVLEENDLVSVEDVVTGGPIGVEVRASAELRGTVVDDVETGISVTERGIAELHGVSVDAADTGIEADDGALVRLWSSSVEAREPLTGATPKTTVDSEIRRPLSALPWFAIAGMAFLASALGLQAVQRLRNPRRARPSAPVDVINTR